MEKLIKPEFKIWDRIRHKNDKTIRTINCIYNDSYGLCDGHILFFKEQDQYELVTNKFDITTLKPFDKVLVRQSNVGRWKPAFWGRHIATKKCPFITSYGATAQVIPFKGNEWLVGTTDDCDDYYKTW